MGKKNKRERIWKGRWRGALAAVGKDTLPSPTRVGSIHAAVPPPGTGTALPARFKPSQLGERPERCGDSVNGTRCCSHDSVPGSTGASLHPGSEPPVEGARMLGLSKARCAAGQGEPRSPPGIPEAPPVFWRASIPRWPPAFPACTCLSACRFHGGAAN